MRYQVVLYTVLAKRHQKTLIVLALFGIAKNYRQALSKAFSATKETSSRRCFPHNLRALF